MAFLKNLKDSIYNPAYYTEVAQKPFSYSLKYFFLFILLLALIGTIALSFKFVPGVKSVLDTVGNKILQYYPAELEIVIKKGEASANVQEPYFLSVPQEWQNSKDTPKVENILVVDTLSEFSIEKFYSYQTYCLLTKTAISCYDDDKAIKTTSLSGMPDVTVNKNTITSLFSKIKPFLKITYPVIALGTFFGVLMVYSVRMIYLIFGALAIWVVASIKKTGIGYKKSYQLGLHLMTAPIIITATINFFYPQFGFPFFFTILLAITAFLNLGQEIKPAAPAQESNNPVSV